MLTIETGNNKKKIQQQIKALKYVMKSDRTEQDKEYHQMALEALEDKLAEIEGLYGCCCNKCKTSVSRSRMYHFIAEDGRILCNKCSEGAEPTSEKTLKELIEEEKRDYPGYYSWR